MSNIYEGKNYFGPGSDFISSKIGFGSYIAKFSSLSRVLIGRYSCIGPYVSVISGKHPTQKFVSSNPSFYSLKPLTGLTYTDEQLFIENAEPLDKSNTYNIVIGNDSWLGSHSKILEGVTIGDGAIVAAGALVVKDVEPYTIVGGVPAKLIKHRFTKDQIDFLMKFKWWGKEQDWIKEHSRYFTDINEFMKKFDNGAT